MGDEIQAHCDNCGARWAVPTPDRPAAGEDTVHLEIHCPHCAADAKLTAPLRMVDEVAPFPAEKCAFPCGPFRAVNETIPAGIPALDADAIVQCARCGEAMDRNGWRTEGRFVYPVFTCHPCAVSVFVGVV